VTALARALAARGGLHYGLLVVRNGKAGQIAQERNPNARLNVLVHVGIRKRFPIYGRHKLLAKYPESLLKNTR